MKKYDYILIGSGPAAYKLSNLLAKTSRKVLVVDGDVWCWPNPRPSTPG